MSSDRDLLKIWVVDALKAEGGSARLPLIAKHIWENHEADLRDRGDMFYTWQYQMRWAGQVLQQAGTLLKDSPTRGSWSLAGATK
ncbi:hypothetical protein [Brevundimonas sp.]|uniref:hypothetical protein n=1 Tax=Brevundimonas sp. TaxID=1871086 RepID=UPI001AC5CBB3|nr:hypothetical protein [Brevundimonas sp.]MBN9464402.1 hypothetical protein [Brevundimonas sp.]